MITRRLFSLLLLVLVASLAYAGTTATMNVTTTATNVVAPASCFNVTVVESSASPTHAFTISPLFQSSVTLNPGTAYTFTRQRGFPFTTSEAVGRISVSTGSATFAVICEDRVSTSALPSGVTSDGNQGLSIAGSLGVASELNRGTITLNGFGDSITAGQCCGLTEAQRWLNIVATAKGWTPNNQGIGGASLPNVWSSIYATSVNASTVSTVLVGQNDAVSMGSATNGPFNWFHGLLGSYLWLLTPNKILANSASVTTTGVWSASDLVSFGIKSTAANATAQVKLFGSAVYVVAHGTNANAATIKVTVDGVDYGPYVIANNYQTSNSKYDIPWGIRVAGLTNKLHTVTATCTPNAGTCYLDYFTSNASQLTRSGPFVWAASPYKNPLTPYSRFEVMDTQVRTAVSQLSSDGLGIAHVDVYGVCALAYGVVDDTDRGCAQADNAHPDVAANQVIANAFLSEMDNFPQPQAKQAARAAATNSAHHHVAKTFWPLAGNTSAPIVRMTVPVDLIIERVHVYMQNQMTGCTTPPRLVLCKGSCTVPTTADVLWNGANGTGQIDSGKIEVLWPKDVDVWMQFQDGAGCTNFGQNFHVTWMYRNARD